MKTLTKPGCPPEHPLQRQEWMSASSGRLSSPTLLLSASFGTGLTLAPDEAEGSLAPCITDATESHTHSPASLLILLPWSLAVVLMAYQTAQWLPGWSQDISYSQWSSQVDNRSTNYEERYFSWKQWGKHHQYFNYCVSAASHGTITTKRSLLLTST